MTQFASYIDRQKSGPGSSEKSQKVHSANWKEEIQLRKELDCLHRQEQQRVSRISSDQRLVVHRFQRKLSLSVDVASKHDKLRSSLDTSHENLRGLEVSPGNNNDEFSLRQLRCLSPSPKPPLPKFRRAKSCEPPKENVNFPSDVECSTGQIDIPQRPVTALERSSKMWERQLNTVTQRLNRARSAPARTSYYRVPEFSARYSVNAAVERKTGQKQRPRTATSVDIDLEYFRRLREREIVNQRQAVKTFLKTIEPLELVPWTPGYEPEEKSSNELENSNSVAAPTRDENANETRPRTRSVTVVFHAKDSANVKTHGRSVPKNVPVNAWT